MDNGRCRRNGRTPQMEEPTPIRVAGLCQCKEALEEMRQQSRLLKCGQDDRGRLSNCEDSAEILRQNQVKITASLEQFLRTKGQPKSIQLFHRMRERMWSISYENGKNGRANNREESS